tara:strand:- start:177 stop:530 length:354 start_codon:yes stop_codon:yes gene_type:complete
MLELQFTGQLNSSLQIGDIVYYLPVTNTANFNVSNTSSAIELGPVIEIVRNNFNEFIIRVDSSAAQPPNNSFFMFSKDNRVNIASVLGYHAEVQFVNNSNKKAEMFSVGSIVQLNSK